MAENDGAQGEGGQENSAPTWTEGFSEEQIGMVTNKGWADPAALLSSYQNAEKLIGVDPSQVLRLPAEMNAESMSDIYGRLGRPDNADGYEFEGIGEEQKAFTDFMRTAAHKHGFSKTQAAAFAAELNEFSNNNVTEEGNATKIRADQDAVDLKKEWGAKHDENMQVARKAAHEFGVDADTIDGLENVLGFRKTMELFNKIGAKIGEHGFENGEGNQGGGFGSAMTPGQAQAELTALSMNEEFTKAFLSVDSPGHKAAVEKKSQLTKYAYPE